MMEKQKYKEVNVLLRALGMAGAAECLEHLCQCSLGRCWGAGAAGTIHSCSGRWSSLTALHH